MNGTHGGYGIQGLAARWATLFLALVLTLGGCASQLPRATSYPATSQNKMQAAQHWNVLADDVAEDIKKAVSDRPDLAGLPLFVKLPTETAFAVTFHDLLTTRLVSRGMQVSVRQEDTLLVEYRVLCVLHKDRFQRPRPGLLTALAAGVVVAKELGQTDNWIYAASGAGVLADMVAGYWSSESNHEVVISTALTYNNRYVMHTSSIYYINDPDWRQYAAPRDKPTMSRDAADGVWERYSKRQPSQLR